MTALHLDSLEIKNFRAFKHLTIEKLGRVNLIVGKNSVGKTALLEALQFYAERKVQTLWSILTQHKEAISEEMLYGKTNETVNYRLQVSRYLFHGREFPFDKYLACQIGENSNSTKQVQLRATWIDSQVDKIHEVPRERLDFFLQKEPAFVIRTHDAEIYYPISNSVSWLQPASTPIRHTFLNTSFPTPQLVESFWDRIILTQYEDIVPATLKIIEPNLVRIAFVSHANGNTIRYPLARISNVENPVPLQSLGEGIVRIFHLSLALSNSYDGFCLVDEIETGLHYTTMYPLWELIFRIAEELNIQVFATTHSDDCVRAFQDAAQANEQVEGQLIRLERWGDKHTAITLDERQLEISVTQNIETR